MIPQLPRFPGKRKALVLGRVLSGATVVFRRRRERLGPPAPGWNADHCRLASGSNDSGTPVLARGLAAKPALVLACLAACCLLGFAAAQDAAGQGLPPRCAEKLSRGLVARPAGDGKVYLSWRLLASDAATPPYKDVSFDVFRLTADNRRQKLNKQPIRKTTDFVVTDAGKAKGSRYYVTRHFPGPMGSAPRPSKLVACEPIATPRGYISLPLPKGTTVQKVGVGDLDGDGELDFVLKTPQSNIDPWYKYWKPSPDTYKLLAVRHDGKLLWTHDCGWAIERGIWYSPYVVCDLDGDGKAEVAVKAGEGDPRDKEGKVQSGPEWVLVLSGQTGKPLARADWPERKLFANQSRGYNYASRNQLGVAYLDGKRACLIVERGTYNRQIVDAYELVGGKLRKRWRWDNKDKGKSYWGQGAHWMHCADIDGDGRDEVLLGSSAIDDTGKELWTTNLHHPDHFYLGDLDPTRKGLEIYYGIESRQTKANGMCMVDAATGKILWGHQGPTRHVHSCGMCSDLDASHPGAECFSTDTDAQKKPAWSRLRSARGEVLSEDMTWKFGRRVAYWDADPQREILLGSSVVKFAGADKKTIRTKRLPGRIEGSYIASIDILGDWREEILTSVPGELRIYVTTIGATFRRRCLLQDPIYRNDVAHAAMGYYQCPMLSYDLATAGKE